jgi:tryptophanyl-tRNA synthetase
MTMPYQAKDLQHNTWRMVFQLLACGVDVKNLFIQSLIPNMPNCVGSSVVHAPMAN